MTPELERSIARVNQILIHEKIMTAASRPITQEEEHIKTLGLALFDASAEIAQLKTRINELIEDGGEYDDFIDDALDRGNGTYRRRKA